MLGILRRVFSFADWNRHNPDKPPPGDMLDASFDAHANRIEELDALVSGVVRPDGFLANHVVDRDSLKPGLFRDFVSLVDEKSRNTAQRVLDLAQEASGARDKAILASETAIQTVSRAESVKNDLETAELRAKDRISALSAKSDQVSALLAQEIEVRTDWDDASSYAQAWADSSRLWAEHMPDTLPDNALKIMDVTGDHWSSRWWANQAANAFGMLTSLYLGAHPVPPATNANGGPIQIGSIYYDTTTGQAMVWDGSQWQSFYGVQRAGILTLWYTAVAGQTVFPLTTPDMNGSTYTINVGEPEGLDVHVNGLRTMPQPPAGGTWTRNNSTSTINFLVPLAAGDRVSVDVLMANEELGPGEVYNWLLKPLVGVDGTKVIFSGLEVAAAGGPNVTVNKDEELLVSVDGVIQQPSLSYTAGGDTVTFMQAPSADSSVFLVWMRSEGGTGIASTGTDTPNEILDKLLLVDGAGSLLDADFLDGLDSTYFAVEATTTAALALKADNSSVTAALALKAPLASPVFTGDPKAPTPTVGDNDTSIATTAFVTGAMASAVPAGTTILFASSTVPLGYLKANGALVNRATYAALFAAIGTAFGAGDGSTTFALPDFRGEFLRGWDDARGVDAARAFGSAQAANVESHTHVATTTAETAEHTHTWSANTGGRSAAHTHNISSVNTPTAGGAYTTITTGNVSNVHSSGMTGESVDHYHGVSGTTSGRSASHTHAMTVNTYGTGTDTRPRNIALLACIKY